MNTIYLRRRCKVHVKEGADRIPVSHVAAIQKNIECLGFVLSGPLLDRLQTLSLEKLASFYRTLVKDLRELVGAHREFRPMYPNFPEQVMEMSEARLYLNALVHYLTNRLPGYEKKDRPALRDQTELRVIELGTREDFEAIFPRLASSKTSLSEQDKRFGVVCGAVSRRHCETVAGGNSVKRKCGYARSTTDPPHFAGGFRAHGQAQDDH